MHPNPATIERFYSAFAQVGAGGVARCLYRFSAPGRMVHNSIDTGLQFDPQGPIRAHQDSFDFRGWSRKFPEREGTWA